jgi:hypothetical protein
MVEIERTAATVSGQTRVGPSAAAEFYGWLELIDQLEGALGQPSAGASNLKPNGGKEPDDVFDI